jgi:acyl dehydratase
MVGKATKPVTYEIDKSQVRRFAAAIGEKAAIHSDEDVAAAAGYRGLVAPPTFAALMVNLAEFAESLDLDPRATMHAEEEYEYARPICSGDLLQVTHQVVDVYDKQAPNGTLIFVVFETRATDARDQPVFKGRRVVVELKK